MKRDRKQEPFIALPFYVLKADEEVPYAAFREREHALTWKQPTDRIREIHRRSLPKPVFPSIVNLRRALEYRKVEEGKIRQIIHDSCRKRKGGSLHLNPKDLQISLANGHGFDEQERTDIFQEACGRKRVGGPSRLDVENLNKRKGTTMSVKRRTNNASPAAHP